MSKIYANPFYWGKPVKGNYYVARETEQQHITATLEKQLPLIISGHRGAGKTSLIKHITENAPQSSIYIDLSFVISRTDLIDHLLAALEKSSPEISRSEQYKSIQDNQEAGLAPICDLLHIHAKQTGTNFIVVWDEFHHIAKLKDNIIPEMKKYLHAKRGISHIFISHREDILHDIFADKQSPFFSQQEFLILKSLDDQAFNRFLTRRFRQMGLSDFDLAQRVLEFTDGQAQLTQKFAHSLAQLWLEGTTARLMEKTLNKMLIEHDTLFTSFWDSFGLNERRLLLGLASGHSQPTELEFIKKYKLSATSTAHNTVLKLLREGWLVNRDEGYYIYDPLFLKWLQNAGGIT